ncbi:retrovirus-related pol polyprotein from transposon TNT 1-94 [Tanacetum coccineum]|uniref:Retrovirus-related pol polyprotein from transposon TNT 1-94 n=1 Tax=Tanacetum coccineum TaxID=301880 RepID=A0ABQ5C3R8_9ASTR
MKSTQLVDEFARTAQEMWGRHREVYNKKELNELRAEKNGQRMTNTLCYLWLLLITMQESVLIKQLNITNHICTNIQSFTSNRFMQLQDIKARDSHQSHLHLESASKEYSDPEQLRWTKIMQRNLALIAKYLQETLQTYQHNLRTSSNTRNKNVDTNPRYKTDNQTGQFGNQRVGNAVGTRETVGGPVVQQSGIQCFNCKEFGHYAKECRKPKRVRDSTFHKEKMLLLQSDWLETTDEEFDDKVEKHFCSFIAMIQEVPNADSGTGPVAHWNRCDDERAGTCTVRFGNDQFAPILGYGDLVQGNITIIRVYYVEFINSISFFSCQLCDADLEVCNSKIHVFVRDLQGKRLTIRLIVDLISIQYLFMNTNTHQLQFCSSWLSSPTIKDSYGSKTFSYLNFDYIKLALMKDIVIGLPILKYVRINYVPSCEVSKAKRSSISSPIDYILGPLLRSNDETQKVLKDFLTMIPAIFRPPVIKAKVVMGKTKKDDDQTVIHNKARLVAKGLCLGRGYDFEKYLLLVDARLEADQDLCRICAHKFVDPDHPDKVLPLRESSIWLNNAREPDLRVLNGGNDNSFLRLLSTIPREMGNTNWLDMFTKALPEERFQYFSSRELVTHLQKVHCKETLMKYNVSNNSEVIEAGLQSKQEAAMSK